LKKNEITTELNSVYKPLLAAGCGGYQSWLGRGNSTTKRFGNLPAIARPKPGRQAQRLPDRSRDKLYTRTLAIILNSLILNNIFMKTQFILIFIFAIALNTKGQKLYDQEKLPEGNYSGYVVTISRDTIYGEIIVPTSFYKLCKEVDFIDKSKSTTTYYPNDLLCFHFRNIHFIGNSWVYAQSTPYFRQGFLQQLVDGFLSYYRYLYLELTSAGPIAVVPKLSEDFYYSYGNLRPNSLGLFKDLLIYTQDNPGTYDTIFNRKFVREDMPNILYNYNRWLISTSKIIEKSRLDSINASTKLNLETAFNDSLLFINKSDANIYQYYLRILYYASNTPGFQSYLIYDERDDYGRTVLIGLKVNIAGKLFKTGTWRYFYENQGKESLLLKREENYDFSGNKHGIFTSYDIKGRMVKTEVYENGNRISK
jgi:hypothetical protein